MRAFAFLLFIACLCSAAMNIVYLKEATVTEGAYCLDGSPAIYFFQPGSAANSTKWVMHFLGGGMCYSDEECYNRSLTNMGSSLYWPPTFSYGGPISENATYNPDFYDWNHVFFAYCDGSAFSGYREKPVSFKGKTIYYRGHRNLIATIKDLLKNKGLDKATDVLVVGDSSGGMATFFHADEIKSMMPKSVTRFKAAPFSGVFLDRPNVEGKPFFGPYMRLGFAFHNCSGGVNQKCVAAYPGQGSANCIFAEYSMNFTESPLFVVGSAYDMIGTLCVLGGELPDPAHPGPAGCGAVPGWGQCEAAPSQCTKEQWQKIEGYADDFLKTIEGSRKMQQNGNGVYEYSCHTHAVEATRAWELYNVKGVSMRDAVRNWFFSDNEPSNKHFYNDCVNHGSYSCNPVCGIPVQKTKN